MSEETSRIHTAMRAVHAVQSCTIIALLCAISKISQVCYMRLGLYERVNCHVDASVSFSGTPTYITPIKRLQTTETMHGDIISVQNLSNIESKWVMNSVFHTVKFAVVKK